MQHYLQASQWEALARFRVESVQGFRVLGFRVLRSSVQGLMLQSSVFAGLGALLFEGSGAFQGCSFGGLCPRKMQDSGF